MRGDKRRSVIRAMRQALIVLIVWAILVGVGGALLDYYYEPPTDIITWEDDS